ncbi:MAG: OmpA family protein [Proteobacteria bacterium]|nr:OmpA family protein [Pseudomonadota bacterium]
MQPLKISKDKTAGIRQIRVTPRKGSGEELVKKIESSYQQDIDQTKARDALAGPLATQGASVLASQTSWDSAAAGVRSLEIILPQETLFSLGKSELGPVAEVKVKKLAKQILTIEGLRSIEIIGHTDSSIPGQHSQWKDNFSLSSVRAGSIAKILMDEKIPEHLIKIRGMGAIEPLLVDRDKKGTMIDTNAAKNRRVHIIVQWNGNPFEVKKDEP